jgi:hypothetical protein
MPLGLEGFTNYRRDLGYFYDYHKSPTTNHTEGNKYLNISIEIIEKINICIYYYIFFSKMLWR